MADSWFSWRLQVLAVLLAVHVMAGSTQPPTSGLGSERRDVATSREFRMNRVGEARKAEDPAPPPDYRAAAVDYLAKGDAADMDTTLSYYGGAEARAALYAADQVAKQTELMEVQTTLLEKQTVLMTVMATALTKLSDVMYAQVYGKP